MTRALPAWKNLSLAQQVAQMIVVRASGHLFDHQIEYPDWEPPVAVLKRWLSDLGVGGVILLGGTAAEVSLRTQQLQDWATSPLLIAADIEEGVGQRFAGATWFPPPMAIGAIAPNDLAQALVLAERMGSATAEEALAIGINWVLAPVVDVNNNPANPVINLRAWGETPDLVSQLTTAFIRGAQRYPVLTTAKHFPGHGDTAVDSHLELPVMLHTLERLDAVEFPPFRAAIQAGVDAVMTAHLKIPALDAEHPATLSPVILTQLLRKTLGFMGLTVTDALVMGAITQRYGANEAAVLAVEAGVDVVLMPVDPEGAIAAICAAVSSGRIAKAQIQASLERIQQAKQKVGRRTDEPSPTGALTPSQRFANLARSETIDTTHRILRASQQHRLSSAPVTQPDTPARHLSARNLIVIDDALNCAFLNRPAPAVTFPHAWGYGLKVVDSQTPPVNWSALEPLPTLLQVFIRGNPFRSSANLIQKAEPLLQFLLETAQLQALVVYGSPYVMEQFRPLLPASLPYVFTYGQMAAAQAIALETLWAGTRVQSAAVAIQEFTD